MCKSKPSQLIFAAALSFGFANGNSAMADNMTFDPTRGDRACEIVTSDMVSTTLDVAVGELQQTDDFPSMCSYLMEGNGRILEVYVRINPFASDEDAAEHFNEFTRDVSPEEMAERLQEIGVDANDPSGIGDRAISVRLKDGIQFENVEGIADQARSDIRDGTLHLRQGSAVLTIDAFYGPPPTLPSQVTPESIAAAEAAWKMDTMALREGQAMELAKAALSLL